LVAALRRCDLYALLWSIHVVSVRRSYDFAFHDFALQRSFKQATEKETLFSPRPVPVLPSAIRHAHSI
jgi:hypothetical protein